MATVQDVEDVEVEEIDGDWLVTVASPGAVRIIARCPYPGYADDVAAGLRQLYQLVEPTA